MRVEPPVGALLDPVEYLVAEDSDALLLHRLVQHAPEIHVEAAEDLLAAIDQRRVDAEAVKDVGEFDGDVAAAARS